MSLERSQVDPPGRLAPAPTENLDSFETHFSLAGLGRHLTRSWLTIVLGGVVGLLVAVAVALLPRHYTAMSKIQVRPGSSSQYRVDKSDLLNLGEDSTKLETETLILESDTLLLDTAKKLGLETNPDFMGHFSTIDPDGPRAEEKLLDRLHKNIEAVRIPRTEIMQVTCNSKSAILSARVVNMLVAEYIQRLFESRFSSTQRVTKWLSGQLNDLKQQVEADQERLVVLQSRLGMVGIDQNHDIIVTELEDLTKAADEARVQRIIAEARFRILSDGDLNLLEGGQDILGRNVPNSSQVSLLANLRNQKAQTEARYAGLNAQFGPKYAEVQQVAAELATLNREIDTEQKRVLNQAQQAFAAASNDEQKTFGTLQGKKRDAFQKQSDLVQYQILLHGYESNRGLYEGLVQRLRQAGIVAGLESSEVDVIDMARVPGKPSELSRVVTLALGLLVGLTGGLMVSLVMSQFDQRLHDLSSIETEMGLPLLSITTMAEKGVVGGGHGSEPLADVAGMFVKHPGSGFVESMWSLRASLLLSAAKHPPRIIMFTSCNPGEGKSTIACGEACALALRDARVLLIDADMRRPTVMRRMGLNHGAGLSSVLTGRATLDEVVQRVEAIPNLSVITSGPVPPSAALLLSSSQMAELVESLTGTYDFILIDSPPLLGLVDSSSLATFSEAIVLVTSYASLNKAQIQRARKVLQRVDRAVTGIALNFADTGRLSDYGFGYGYGYQYERGKDGAGA
jgi:succinoglycan biosynthesis transport protein ExoP